MKNGDFETHELKVGELARRAGLSVRTLHYYDEIGLLVPSRQSSSGHRVYGVAELARLQQILSLRSLGFPLDDVRDFLDRPDVSPLRVIELHLSRLDEQIALHQRLRDRLQAVAERLRSAEEVSAETFLETIEVTTMFEKYYTPEQLQKLRQRREIVGEERMRQAQDDWRQLYADVEQAIAEGLDPASAEAQALRDRWQSLIEEFTGGDPGIAASLEKMYASEPAVAERYGPQPAVADYMARVAAARKDSDPTPWRRPRHPNG